MCFLRREHPTVRTVLDCEPHLGTRIVRDEAFPLGLREHVPKADELMIDRPWAQRALVFRILVGGQLPSGRFQHIVDPLLDVLGSEARQTFVPEVRNEVVLQERVHLVRVGVAHIRQAQLATRLPLEVLDAICQPRRRGPRLTTHAPITSYIAGDGT